MTRRTAHGSPLHRAVARATALALAAAGSAGLGAVTAPAANAAETGVSAATLTWGVSGYAQAGVASFGPWTFKNLTGNVAQLVGSVSGGSQSEYAVGAVPATSMPSSDPQKTPNAVKFTAGAGTADPATNAVEIAWEGSYTINAYPAHLNAPNEVYSDPQLSLDADGDGELTMDVTIGAGVDMQGNPTAPVELGRLPLLTFSDGSVTRTSHGRFRATPDYQGVAVTLPDGPVQTTSCTATEGATGWWGSWPQEFVSAMPTSVRPHFYSTGCGGSQDNKPALPVDVSLGLPTGSVQVSQATLSAAGSHEVTVTGTNFDPEAATGTRPPLMNKPAGVYIAFGKYAANWRPSQSAPSSARKNAPGVQWAVLAGDMGTIGGVADGAVELSPEGTFTATLTVDKGAIDAVATDPALTTYGIYTYAGSGSTEASYETFTPITFVKESSTLSVTAPARTYGQTATAAVAVSGPGTNTGTVTIRRGGTTLGTAALQAGSAVLDLGRLAAGAHTLRIAYSGDGATAAGSTVATLRVAKAKGAATLKLAKKPGPGRTGRAKVTVKSATAGVAAGRVTFVLRNGAKVVKRVKGVKLGAKSVARFALPKLGKGGYRVVVKYAGNPNVTKARKALTFTVR